MFGSCMADDRELARAWQAVLGQLQIDLAPSSYTTFLVGTSAARRDGDTLLVEGNRLNVDQVNGAYNLMIERAAYRVFGEDLRVFFVPKGSAAAYAQGDEHPASADITPGPSAGPIVGVLDRSYTFERYIPADGNKLAMSACEQVLADVSYHANPVVIFGRPGLGKTHLLHSLAQRAAARGWSVALVTAEDFTTRFTRSLRDHSIDEFHAAMRPVRLLLIDDLHDLVGKTKTQEEFGYTMDAIGHAGGSVVATSEQDPKDLPFLDRLGSRISEGYTARVLPFMLAERRQYVDMLAREQAVSLPTWAVDRIVGMEVPSVRALRGAVNDAIQLVRCQMLDLQRLDAVLTRIAVIEATTGDLGERELLDAVARHFSLCFDDLASNARTSNVTGARAIAAAALQEKGKSLAQIGELLGRNRGTIAGLAERGHRLLASEPGLRARLAG